MLYSILFAYNSVIQEFRQGPAAHFFPSVWCLGSLSSIQLLTGLVWKMHRDIRPCLMPHCSSGYPMSLPTWPTWAYRWEGAEVWSVDVLKQVVCWILANSQCKFWDLIILLFLICSAFSGLSPSSGDYHQGWGRRCWVTGRPSPGELDRASVTFHWEMCMAGRQQKQHWSELIRKWGNWDEWTPFTQRWL